MSVFCESCVLSGSLCDRPIPRPEETHQLWCVLIIAIRKALIWGSLGPRGLFCYKKRR
jgi:hypothetical protein